MRRIIISIVVGVIGVVAIGAAVSARFGARDAQAATSATFTVNAPANAQPLAMPFDVTVDLSGVTFDAFSTAWGGYDLEFSYDSTLLSAAVVGPTLCPQGSWGDASTPGHVATGCAFQTSTSTAGVLETISFTCLRDGTSNLHLLPHYDPSATVAGTALFDWPNAADFNMTLVDGTVTCQTGAPTSTPTDTPTSTPTPTITGTPTATRSWTATPTIPASSPTPPDPLAQYATTYQVNALHDGHAVGMLAPPLEPAWSINLDVPVGTAVGLLYPLVVNGRVFVTTRSTVGNGTRLYAIDDLNGSILWGPIYLQYSLYNSLITADATKVYALDLDGLLRAFDQIDGHLVWQIQLQWQGWFRSAPIVSDGRIFVTGSGSGVTLYAVDAAGGTLLWSAVVHDAVEVSAAATSDGVFVASSCRGYRLDPPTGRILWAYDLGCMPDLSIGGMPVVHDGKVYIRNGYPFTVRSEADGSLIGAFDSQDTPAFDGTLQFITSYSGVGGMTVSGVDLVTGDTLWSQQGDGRFYSAPLAVDGSVVMASEWGDVVLLDEHTGAVRWSGSLPSFFGGLHEPSGFAVGDGMLFVPADTTLVAFRSVSANRDGDACPDSGELRLGTNAKDPWDFYSVPVPALFAAANPSGETRDNAVGPGDAQAIFAYSKRGAKAGSAEYEQDLNGNGIADGIEYDRSFIAAGRSGAPDGIVSASDAQLAFAQFKMNYKC